LKTLLPTLLLVLGMLPVHAQSIRYPVSLPYISLTAYSIHQNDPFSFAANQAALAGSKQTGIGIYGEQRYLLTATGAYAAAVAVPTAMGNFGIRLNYAGFKNFNESGAGLAYAKRLGKQIDIGIQFNYYSYRVPAYTNASSVNVEAGLLYHFSDKLNGGIHVYNPTGSKLGKSGEERLPAIYKFGLGYDASDNFFTAIEMLKEEDKPVTINAGFQYLFARQFFVKGGFISETSAVYVGAGIGWTNVRIDVATSYHPQLGFSPGILLIANFKNKTE
jgi:hypothetical protein